MSEVTAREHVTINTADCSDCGAAAGVPCYPACTSRWAPDVQTFPCVPELPSGQQAGDGMTWIGRLADGWHAIALWGADGWDLGEWPYVIVAHYDNPAAQVYAVATYCEGDVDARAFTSRAERDAETDTIAAWHWRNNDNGPDDLADADEDLAPEHRGPVRPPRLITTH